MKKVNRITMALALGAALTVSQASAGVVPVVDGIAIERAVANGLILTQQLKQLSDQLQTQKNQLESMTGNRGMGGMMADSPRNNLPPDWNQAMDLLKGNSGPTYGDLANSARQIQESQAVLSSSEAASLSPQMQQYLQQMRGMSANQQALGQQAYNNSSQRVQLLQRLSSSIDSSTDPKAIMDLQAVAQSEQAKLANDQAQLQSVLQLTQANEAAARQMQNEMRMQVSGEPEFPTLDTTIRK
ncbi:type IV secretion system protein [Pseudomonas viridiflava]|uniref:type IV secretion system protein n=1 Tax=Pseudomonas viridiflava TaxID=33069 RepID=UPI000F070CBE|nr:type IV secretion system protein [Pseudomonas viridiflava]